MIPVSPVANLILPLLTQFRKLFRHYLYECIHFDSTLGHLQCSYHETRSTCFNGKQDHIKSRVGEYMTGGSDVENTQESV